jgi:hypothetical protein
VFTAASLRTLVVVRLTEFWRRMDERFGPQYARSLAADYRLPELAATADEALRAGSEAKQVWHAVCAEFEMPAHLR